MQPTTSKQTSQLHEGLKKSFVIAVGPKTAEAMKEYHVRVDMVPQKYSSEGLLEVLQGKDIKGKKIRIPRTSNATPTLTNQLREMGADVEEIYVYESGLPVDEALKDEILYRPNRRTHKRHSIWQRIERQKHLQNAHRKSLHGAARRKSSLRKSQSSPSDPQPPKP